MAVLFVSLILLFASCQGKYLHEPLTKEAIDYINNFATWKADPDYAGYDEEHFKMLCGVPLDDNITPKPKKLGLLKGLCSGVIAEKCKLQTLEIELKASDI